ncbi:MAG: uroporphyrinogen decarboxylase family protein [Actinomycetota bacterium]|nr:uroporphyrinogen decarboxylase family protein [Actinomycetota bacterium]
MAVLYGFCPEAALDTFSLGRGLMPFIKDCMRYPDKVELAADDLTDNCAFVSSLVVRLMGVRRIKIFVHRSSMDFISPKTFKEVSVPNLKRLAEVLVAKGIGPILHLDGNWDLNLETLRELSAGYCVVQFDDPTDIFLAKEVIGDRICIMGDVPADMPCLDSTSEVDEYCHRPIEEVGKGGGYVMGAGYEMPPNARPENFRTMIESVNKYG